MVSRKLDSWFKESLKDDYQIFDGKFDIEISHNEKNATSVDLKNRSVTHFVTKTLVKDCIFRSFQERDTSTVTSIRERFRSIQNDMIDKIDTVIEAPLLTGLVINEGDLAENLETHERWQIIAVDKTTIGSRYRLGCQKYV